MNRPPTMPEAVREIIRIASETDRPEREVYEEKKAEWGLPTAAPWGILRRFPYS